MIIKVIFDLENDSDRDDYELLKKMHSMNMVIEDFKGHLRSIVKYGDERFPNGSEKKEAVKLIYEDFLSLISDYDGL